MFAFNIKFDVKRVSKFVKRVLGTMYNRKTAWLLQDERLPSVRLLWDWLLKNGKAQTPVAYTLYEAVKDVDDVSSLLLQHVVVAETPNKEETDTGLLQNLSNSVV
ncbi:hypothetical protein MIR68_000820 [Amoeboaphelidium protococcarum]|nr:hypothetical protein MIR68_000820 [Amoeboaphelidium protococcarum]